MTSQALAGAGVRAEIGVVARSQYASVVHRFAPDSDEPRPACHEADVDHAETISIAGTLEIKIDKEVTVNQS